MLRFSAATPIGSHVQGGVMQSRSTEAALLLAALVPGATTTYGTFRELHPQEFARLSSGERAAYELATDLFCGSSSLARFVAFADQRFAGVFIGAITVALGERLVPVEENVSVIGGRRER